MQQSLVELHKAWTNGVLKQSSTPLPNGEDALNKNAYTDAVEAAIKAIIPHPTLESFESKESRTPATKAEVLVALTFVPIIPTASGVQVIFRERFSKFQQFLHQSSSQWQQQRGNC